MSRTNRKNITERNHREARKGSANSRQAWSASLGNGWKRKRAGRPSGLLMHGKVASQWGDDYYSKTTRDRKIERRVIKRRERRIALKEATS